MKLGAGNSSRPEIFKRVAANKRTMIISSRFPYELEDGSLCGSIWSGLHLVWNAGDPWADSTTFFTEG